MRTDIMRTIIRKCALSCIATLLLFPLLSCKADTIETFLEETGRRRPAFDLSPGTNPYDFGSVAVGSTGSLVTFTITNTGTADLTITSTVLADTTNYTLASSPSSPITPGASSTFTVTFNPASPGTKVSSITITHNAAGSPSVVNITGLATGVPEFSVAPDPNPYDFGLVEQGDTSGEMTFTITNTGTADLTIASTVLADTTNYTLTASPTSPIGPGASSTFKVIFNPTTTGTITSSITISHNATGSPSVVNIAGKGVETCVYSWTEDDASPLFGGSSSGTDRAYYPFVVKVGSTYHVWYGDGDSTRHATSQFADFHDITHPAAEITVGGTAISDTGYTYMYHPYVLHNTSGWTVNGTTYTEPFLMYITPGFNSVRVYRSTDGAEWTEIGLCTGITGAYAPQGGNVYSFAVLHEGGSVWKAYADNGGGQIQYYTSTDGFAWTGTAANILGSNLQTWEDGTPFQGMIAPFIIKVGTDYLLYYSGGTTRNDNAIGKAVSTDGQTFIKDGNNPIFSISDGVAWRAARTYTARVFYDEDRWRMYFTGVSAAGVYSVGTATTCDSP